ncbi:MAG: LD-carboxypeptidase [Acidobacteria bacterium]|nr:LD-carboxypeptidase [Acidobacteriota bacterium]
MSTLPTIGELQRPPALQQGDKIGIVAPSFPSAAWYPERFARALDALTEHLQVTPVVAQQTRIATGFSSGSPVERADALEMFMKDPSIKAIFFTTGGFNSADLLPLIDWGILQRQPKIILGYSDLTSILIAGMALGSCVTFYGPTVLPQFGEYPQPLPYTLTSLRDAVMAGRAPLDVPDPPSWTNEFLDWGGPEWSSRPRTMSSPASSVVIRPGKARGRLFGGNLETLNFLAGTRYLCVPDELVLFFEVTANEAYLPRVRRALRHLEQVGLFNHMRALLVGRAPDCTPAYGVTLHDLLQEVTAAYSVPVIADLPFGHTDPMTTLPIGVLAQVVASAGSFQIQILDSGVAAE